MKCGCLYFHQGWTDIMNQLSLINYYNSIYDELNVIMRRDAEYLVNFYIRNLKGVTTQYIELNGRYHVPDGYDILFHGLLDPHRNDKYKNKFVEYCQDPSRYKIFTEGFYVAYDIPHNVKVDYFTLERDLFTEQKTYNSVVKEYGEKYVIYHADPTNNSGIATTIDFPASCANLPKINLNGASPIFFNYLETIYNAQEIHLIDSIWASLCYQMDAKYGFFKDKQINVYTKRGHRIMFEIPKHLKNWNII